MGLMNIRQNGLRPRYSVYTLVMVLEFFVCLHILPTDKLPMYCPRLPGDSGVIEGWNNTTYPVCTVSGFSIASQPRQTWLRLLSPHNWSCALPLCRWGGVRVQIRTKKVCRAIMPFARIIGDNPYHQKYVGPVNSPSNLDEAALVLSTEYLLST